MRTFWRQASRLAHRHGLGLFWDSQASLACVPVRCLDGSQGPQRFFSSLVSRAAPCASRQAMTSSVSASLWSIQRRGMFIQTQPTPNPASLMFLPGQKVMDTGTREFQSPRQGMSSPLAKKLFTIDGVKSLFFGSDFITVTKNEDYNWAILKPDIFAAMSDHFASGEPLILDQQQLDPATAIMPEDDEVVAMIKELLETRIRPAVQDDGGDVLFKEFNQESGMVKLKMVGACSGCPSSSLTLKSGIENMMKHYIPEVTSVVAAEPDEAEEAGIKEFEKLEAQLSA